MWWDEVFVSASYVANQSIVAVIFQASSQARAIGTFIK